MAEEALDKSEFLLEEAAESEISSLRNRKVIDCAKETLENASKLLRRKIPCTGHFMTPRKLWIQTVPTRECDVVIMFPNGAQDNTLMWLLSRLRAGTPGLVVHVRHHASSHSYGFYLTAPFNVLLKAAEEVHLPKSLKSGHGGGLKEFVQAEADYFEGIEDSETFFSTQERQYLVLHLLQTLRASDGDTLSGLKLIDGQPIIPKCESAGIISQVFPLHDLDVLKQLQNNWVRAFFNKQPLDCISNYFGVKIAMYFAWLGYYTAALIVPAVVGCAFSIGYGKCDQATEDIGFVVFSFFNVLWFSVYLEAWKRYSAELAYKWGTLDQRDELLVEPRPLFSGTLEISPVTGRLEPFYPPWKRYMFRYFVSIPIIGLCLIIVFVIMMLNLKLQDWWDRQIEDRGYAFCLSYLPKIMLAIGITLLDEAYYKVACWLNDKENYRLETKYENHLIVKVALFQFVNSFLSLFYIAFYLQDQEKLKEQLAALLIARQVIGNLKESALPYFMEQLRLAKMSFEMFGALSPSDAEKNTENPTGNRNVSQAELESSLFKYDGTFADHLEMFIQLGYVVLFSSAFPLAALCALINNLVEMRSDAFKLCFIFQRPFGERVPNIGTWQNAMEVMGLIAVLVNCALIGLSGQVQRMFPEMSTTQNILLIVALEHVMLLLRLIVKVAIPDLPEWVATEMAKVEFARREAMRKLSSTGSPPLQPTNQENSPTSVKSIGRFVVSATASTVEETLPEPEEVQPDVKSIDREISESESSTPQKPKLLPSNIWEGDPPSYHMTVGPHIDWVERLGLDVGVRKSSEPDMGGIHRSTATVTSHKDVSSDSDLLRSVQPWPPQAFQLNTPAKVPAEAAAIEVASEEGDLAAKKLKVKQSLMKRARSVAIFSLKLKEKRAAAEAKEKEKSKEKEKPSVAKPEPVEHASGELSYIPIEKLISVDDVATTRRRKISSSTNN
ncbi:anoctamin-8 [Cimex lectularius]|uniref:Anoctamin n=1 Tax=Cimex lectularius TaxID=79782 RepID=A0A8I6RS39_CIMLE|nr:anoctamin-8 [Cimex lectularius]